MDKSAFGIVLVLLLVVSFIAPSSPTEGFLYGNHACPKVEEVMLTDSSVTGLQLLKVIEQLESSNPGEAKNLAKSYLASRYSTLSALMVLKLSPEQRKRVRFVLDKIAREQPSIAKEYADQMGG